jgi:hypothetical protein
MIATFWDKNDGAMTPTIMTFSIKPSKDNDTQHYGPRLKEL